MVVVDGVRVGRVGSCGCDGFNFVICFDGREEKGTEKQRSHRLTCRMAVLPEGEFARVGSNPTSRTGN